MSDSFDLNARRDRRWARGTRIITTQDIQSTATTISSSQIYVGDFDKIGAVFELSKTGSPGAGTITVTLNCGKNVIYADGTAGIEWGLVKNRGADICGEWGNITVATGAWSTYNEYIVPVPLTCDYVVVEVSVATGTWNSGNYITIDSFSLVLR
jgi:hypothetical protein